MANIAEYLKKILSSRYGRDVRQSIHDGINAINEEVIDYGATASQKAAEAAEKANAAAASARAAATSEINAKTYENNTMTLKDKAGNYASTASKKADEAAARAIEAAQAVLDAQASAADASDKADAAAVSATAAGEYKKQAQSIIDNQASILEEINKKLKLAEFSIDENGNLTYTDNSGFIFTVNDNGYLEWEVVA